MPAVASVLAIETGHMILVEILCKNTVVRAFAEPAAVLHRAKSLVEISSAHHHHAPWSLGGLARNDVDHSIHRVGSPNGCARSANHFDAFDVLEWHVQHIPKDAAKRRSVDVASIDQDQQLIAEAAIQSTSADGPGIGSNLGNVHS